MKKQYALILISFFLMKSCIKTDCKAVAKVDRENECLLILEKSPSDNQAYLTLEGKSIEKGTPCKCKDQGRWWLTFRDYMSVGDTLIKRKGELVFYIHKKDTVLSFPWKCEGKIYK